MRRWERILFAILTTVGVAAVATVVWLIAATAHQAEVNQANTSARSFARITSLTRTANANAVQLRDDGTLIGQLLADVAALQNQVTQLGARPVVVQASTAPTTTTAPRSSTTTTRPTTSTTRPSPTTTTTRPKPCTTIPLIGACT